MNERRHHWRDGWHFNRQADGSVRVTKNDHSASGDTRVDIELVIPASEWASIVASMTGGGETSDSFRAAQMLHRSGVNQ